MVHNKLKTNVNIDTLDDGEIIKMELEGTILTVWTVKKEYYGFGPEQGLFEHLCHDDPILCEKLRREFQED